MLHVQGGCISASHTLPTAHSINLEATEPQVCSPGNETGQTTFSLHKTDPMSPKQQRTALSSPQGSVSRDFAQKGTHTKSYLCGPLGYMRDSRPKQKVKAWTCGCSFLTPKEAGGPQHTGTAETHLAHASVHHEVPERRWRGHFTILGCKAHPGKGTKKEGPAMDGARGGTAFLCGRLARHSAAPCGKTRSVQGKPRGRERLYSWPPLLTPWPPAGSQTLC